MATQIDIIAGPSREELFDALRLRHEGRKVMFTIPPSKVRRVSDTRFKIQGEGLEVIVDQIGVEDGSGGSWILRLYDPAKSLGSECLEAWFHTTRRKGWVKPI